MAIEELWPARWQAAIERLREAANGDDLLTGLLAIEAASPDDERGARAELERLSSRVSEKLRRGASPRGQAEALSGVLADEGFEGDAATYHAAENSHLTRVLERRRGMPILLSAVWVLVGRGAGLEVEGVGLPGHFIARVGGPEGALVDPFGGGAAMSIADCKRMVRRLSGGQLEWRDDFLLETPLPDLLDRVLRNLVNSYRQGPEAIELYRTTRQWAALRPDEAEPKLALAGAAERLGAVHEARETLVEVATRFGDTAEAKRARDVLERLSRRGAANLPGPVARGGLRGRGTFALVARPSILSLPERLDAHPDYAGRGVCLAFVDSGFFPHPDLMLPTKRIRAYADVTRDELLPSDLFEPRASSWHGTMTACCSAGNGHASSGRYRGLASEAEVVLIRAATAEGRVLGRNVASAIRFPLRHPELGIRIMNVSLGVDRHDPHAREVEEAVAEVTEAGVAVFAAAGNDPSSRPEPPASAAEAITVGGSNDQNTRSASDDTAWPSSHVDSTRGPSKPDLLAPAIWLPAPMLPGTHVAREAGPLFDLLRLYDEMSLQARFFEGREGHDGGADDPTLRALREAVEARVARQKLISPDYQHVDGTSFAAPIAASIAAQMLEACPSLTPALLRKGLVATAEPLPQVPRPVQGAGVLSPRRAVEWALARSHEAKVTPKQ